MSMIDLSSLPAPAVVEEISADDILAGIKEGIIASLPDMPEIADLLARESEPMVKQSEHFAYLVSLVRTRINSAAMATYLTHATGTDLDSRAADFGLVRTVVTPADPENDVDEVPESDDALRARIRLFFASMSVAGPAGAYRFHAMSSSGLVKDALAFSPSPAFVTVSILSHEGDGTPSPALLSTVSAALMADGIRPITDFVSVQPAAIIPYVIEAELEISSGPDPETVRAAAEASAMIYANDQHAIGQPVVLSGLYAALHGAGVNRVRLISPAADIEPTETEAAYCTAVTVTIAEG